MARLTRLIYIWLLLGIVFVRPIFAGIPSVTNVVVWNNNSHTILNVTVSHFPASFPSHYVDRIIVSVDGGNHTFNVAQPLGVVTFIVSCDLNVIEGTPLALVWAHCLVDGYSSEPYGPIQIPEFSTLILLLTLALSTTLVACALRKAEFRHS